MVINRVNEVWCSDIMYIRLLGSHVYLTVIMDWHSRYIIEWEISTTLESAFCIRGLKQALSRSRCKIFIERLWRTIKQKCVYLHNFASVDEAIEAIEVIGNYISYYNTEQMHQGLDYHTPTSVYFGQVVYDAATENFIF